RFLNYPQLTVRLSEQRAVVFQARQLEPFVDPSQVGACCPDQNPRRRSISFAPREAQGRIGLIQQNIGRKLHVAGAAVPRVGGTHIGGDAFQDGRRRLRAVKFLRDKPMDEAFEIWFGGIPRYDTLCGIAGEIGDRLGIEFAVAAMAAEQRGGYVGRSGCRGDPGKMEIGVAASVAMTTRTTKADSRGLTTEQ